MATLLDSAWRLWTEMWPHILATTLLTANIGVSVHALLTKRDTRSTMAWVGLVWLSPGFGAIALSLIHI